MTILSATVAAGLVISLGLARLLLGLVLSAAFAQIRGSDPNAC